MKKFLGIAISTLLVGSMLIGCGSDADTTTTEAATTAELATEATPEVESLEDESVAEDESAAEDVTLVEVESEVVTASSAA